MDYGERFEEALVYAARLHRGQHRKGEPVPYVTHLMAVAALTGQAGGDEDEVIAALLHDAVEDQGGHPTLAEIRVRFGERVADIVNGCTDAWEKPKPPWRARKQGFLERLEEASSSVVLVTCADKVHNAHCTLSELRRSGDALLGVLAVGELRAPSRGREAEHEAGGRATEHHHRGAPFAGRVRLFAVEQQRSHVAALVESRREVAHVLRGAVRAGEGGQVVVQVRTCRTSDEGAAQRDRGGNESSHLQPSITESGASTNSRFASSQMKSLWAVTSPASTAVTR